MTSLIRLLPQRGRGRRYRHALKVSMHLSLTHVRANESLSVRLHSWFRHSSMLFRLQQKGLKVAGAGPRCRAARATWDRGCRSQCASSMGLDCPLMPSLAMPPPWDARSPVILPRRASWGAWGWGCWGRCRLSGVRGLVRDGDGW